MKKVKKLFAGILVIAMMLSILPNISGKTVVQAAGTVTVTAPANKALVAAGYIDIAWSSSSGAKNYELYINKTKVTTTTSTHYVFYTTDVAYHSVYVKANFTNGTSATSATNTFGVSKKGLGLATDMGQNAKLKDWGVAWYYNWGESRSYGAQYSGVEYVPMVWKETNATNFKNRVNKLKSSGYKYVLTFNEPEFSNQCNMSVDQVYATWKGISDVTGIKVASPVSYVWPKSSDFFKAFNAKLTKNDHPMDFIAIHCYPDNWGGKGMADWFLEEVVDYTWNTYHKPIWITEFSTNGQYVSATGDNGTKEFWENVMPGLDSRPYVERYAAFGFNAANAANKGLWNYSTGALTAAGQVYSNLGNPTKASTAPVPTEKQTQEPTTKAEIKKPAKVKIKSASKKKTAKKAKIVIAKVKGAKGFQIRYCDNKKFDGYESKTIKKNTTKFTLKGLEKKTKYYVKIRAYNKKRNGKKQYGKWSRIKKIKMK